MRSVLVLVFATSTVWADKAPTAPKQPVITAAAAAKIPDPGWLVAYEANDSLVIARITKTGPKELLRKPHSNSYSTWIDAKTLVHVELDDKNIEVTWIVDGVVDPKRTVKHKADVWKLKSTEEYLSILVVARAADGGIWIERCITEMMPDCNKSTWLRVDTATTKLSRTKPGKLTGFGVGLRAPDLKAPAGYSAKIAKIKSTVDPKRKVTAIECTGPKGKIVWSQESPPIDPAERFTPKKVRWILSTPALLEVEGLAVNPVGQEDTVQYIFRDCGAAPYEGIAWIGDNTWSYSTRDSDDLQILVDDVPIAVLTGSQLRAAPK